ncbi:MAG: hypothetical protein IKE70_02775 [Bacilli bacterium]|nr:hypothetical protein [Bacilli bacterium]
MEKEEKIKNLLMDLKDNPKRIIELEKYFVNDVVEVALKYGLYESLIITFQPITIDGEIKICLDAFSSNILEILRHSCDSKEQAIEEAKQEFEKIQERNRKLSDEEKEWYYNPSTYEEILNTKVVIPKEIKDKLKKILFTIDYEKISRMKIKNCHAREISGWNHSIETVEDVIIYSELPNLMASIDLFHKNIRTTMNDTEGVLEDSTISKGISKIWIHYESLSQENKNIVEGLIDAGCAKKFMDGNKETISIFVPCSKDDTVDEVSNKLREIVSHFEIQDIHYGFGTMEEIYQSYVPIIERYPKYLEGLFTNGLNLKDLIALGKMFGDNLYYDKEEDLIWKSPLLYQRHKRYKDSQTSNHNVVL